jgi:hypothetical protein
MTQENLFMSVSLYLLQLTPEDPPHIAPSRQSWSSQSNPLRSVYPLRSLPRNRIAFFTFHECKIGANLEWEKQDRQI